MMSYKRVWNVKGYAWQCIAVHWLCSSVMLGYHQMINDETYLIKRESNKEDR